MKLKMYCIFAKESVDKMKGNRGKLASMAGHAYLHAYWNAVSLEVSSDWNLQAIQYKNSDHAYKITLIVDTVAELEVIQEAYKNVCGVSLVKDAGFTVFNEPTVTCLGLGPIREDLIGEDLKALKLFM
jgi:peptidyl-tRNA hydrolase